MQHVISETRLERVDLSKNSAMQELCLYRPRKSKPKDYSELRKQHLEYTVTLFDCNHLAHVIKFYGKCKNLCVTVQFLLCFILNLRAISEYKPQGACIWRGDLSEGFFCFTTLGELLFGGAYTWGTGGGGGLFSEFYGMSLFLGGCQ